MMDNEDDEEGDEEGESESETEQEDCRALWARTNLYVLFGSKLICYTLLSCQIIVAF